MRNTFRVGGGALADPDEKRSLLNLAVALFEARGEFAFYTLKYYVCSLLQTAVYLGTGNVNLINLSSTDLHKEDGSTCL